MRKIKILTFLILFFVFLGISLETRADAQISTELVDKKNNVIHISSEKSLKKVRIYKKVNDKFILVSKINTEAKAVSYTMPKDKLSTEETTTFKVVVNQENEETKKDVSFEKIVIAPINPEETAKPSVSTSPIPTKPTPSQSMAPSQSATPSQSTTPSQTASQNPTSEQTNNNSSSENTNSSQTNNDDQKSGFKKEDGKTYYYEKGKKVKGKKVIDGDEYYFNNNTGVLEGRINGITYMNQSKGVYQNGKWTHTNLPSTKTSTGKTFASSACGIFSCSMAITSLRGKLTLPTEFNSIKYGFNGNGSNPNVTVLTSKKFDLKGKQRSYTKQQLINDLMAGKFVVVWVHNSVYGASGNNRGGDTGHGGHHFVLIHGYKNGKFAIADPNNMSQSYVMSSSHKLNSWESFNSHLGNGKNGSYGVIWK